MEPNEREIVNSLTSRLYLRSLCGGVTLARSPRETTTINEMRPTELECSDNGHTVASLGSWFVLNVS
jgi:hypothetical protein